LIKFDEIKRAFLVSAWFMFLTFPIMVIRVNPVEHIVEWRWKNMALVGIGSFFLSFVWNYLMKQKELGFKKVEAGEEAEKDIYTRAGRHGDIHNYFPFHFFNVPDQYHDIGVNIRYAWFGS
jgi:hypothetical protein